MYLEDTTKILPGQFVRIRYDCQGGFERCGKEWQIKLRDAEKNASKNGGQHVCRQCQLRKDNPTKRPEVQAKIKQINLERYGATCAMNTKENTEARVAKMFGTEEAVQARSEKARETFRTKYGVDHPMQLEETQEKQRQTMQEKYGVDHPLQSEEMKEKTRQTVRDRYGVDNVMALPDVKARVRETMKERYGVEYYNQLSTMRQYLRENISGWLCESWANPWAKGITRPEEWNEKQRQTVAELMNAGAWKGGNSKYRGLYTSDKCRKKVAIFRSGYELKVHWHLDHDPKVSWYDYEPFQVPYNDTEGHKRHYTPDFIVKYVDVDRYKVIEVKNNYNRNDVLVKPKYEGFLAECGDEVDFTFWANDEINALGLDIDVILRTGRIELWE